MWIERITFVQAKPKTEEVMKDRIQQIIDYKGISAGDLAEVLDVQRSNISHILNGRNKPGAVFIEKLLQAFPDVNARWLLTGEGPMLFNEITDMPVQPAGSSSESSAGNKIFPPSDSAVPQSGSSASEKTIDKIVLLYSDGTFTYYNNK